MKILGSTKTQTINKRTNKLNKLSQHEEKR